MPQLNVAPSPSPVVAPPTPANAGAPAEASATPGTPGDVPAQPFAAVLNHQVSQQANASSKGTTDKSTAAATTSKTDSAATDQPAPDAIAALAQMLPGIVPPAGTKQGAEDSLPGQGEKAKKVVVSDDNALPVMLAAPVLPAIPVVPTAPNAATATDGPAIDTSKVNLAPGLAANRAENLAAEAHEAASSAASGKQEAADFASLLAAPQPAAVQAQHAAPTVAPAAASHNVETPVGTRGWDNEVGQKLTWMVNKHETRAELVLNPPELGRIEVSITMKGDQASATFVSANPTVRDAIENAVPRLREVLQDAGISLGQTQVGAESFQQQQSAGKRENGDNSWRGGNAGATSADTVVSGVVGGSAAPTIRRGNGMVDTFA